VVFNDAKGYCGGNSKSCATAFWFYLFHILLMFFLQKRTLRQLRSARGPDVSYSDQPFVFFHLSQVGHVLALFPGASPSHTLRISTQHHLQTEVLLRCPCQKRLHTGFLPFEVCVWIAWIFRGVYMFLVHIPGFYVYGSV
jgi:hypothetical protein